MAARLTRDVLSSVPLVATRRARFRAVPFSLILLVLVVGGQLGAAKEGALGGDLKGRWIQADGARPAVTFSYHREVVGEGRISTQLGADGERFVGQYLRITGKHPVAKVRRFYLAWNAEAFDDYRVGPSGATWVRTEMTFDLFRERYKDTVVATLIGNRGSKMRCRFSLEDHDVGLPGGATGSCQVSTGDELRIP